MKLNKSEYIINFFGTAMRYWITNIPNELMSDMESKRMKLEKSWTQLLFDFNFLEFYGYKNWCDLSTSKEKYGLVVDNYLRIEIRKNGRMIEKINYFDFTNDNLFYPLYCKRSKFLSWKNTGQFLIIQMEKGLVDKFRIKTEKLNMDKLIFDVGFISQFPLNPYLTGISYDKISLPSTTNETIVSEFKVFQIPNC
jgi:hypothetical protein